MAIAKLDSTAPHIVGAREYDDLVDWGVQSDAIAGVSKSTGRLLYKGPNNSPETGVWVCTPGTWRLAIPRDELCHFVAGHAIYTSDEGEVIEVKPETLVMFPAGWSGQCEVRETIRNLYMLV